jgi:site-specific recombinase XerD
MDGVPAKIPSLRGQGAETWINAYKEEMLEALDGATIEAYTRILKRFAEWLKERPGNHDQFHPQAITRTAIEFFLDTLPSSSYKKQACAALSGFCRWLQEDHQLLGRNPVRGVYIPAQALLAPRELSGD